MRLLACWDFGFDYHQGHECLSFVSVVCCQVEVSASSLSLIQRSRTKSECDCETLIMRRLRPSRGCCAMGGKKIK